MHYFVRDHLDDLASAHIEFLKKVLSNLNWVIADVAKMREVQAQKLCEKPAGTKPASKPRKSAHKKQASTKRTRKVH